MQGWGCSTSQQAGPHPTCLSTASPTAFLSHLQGSLALWVYLPGVGVGFGPRPGTFAFFM